MNQVEVKIYASFLAYEFDNLWLYVSSYECDAAAERELLDTLKIRMGDMYFFSQTKGYKVIHFMYKTEISNERYLRSLLEQMEADASNLVKPLVRKTLDSIYY